ncbi:20213_t:CDS:2 [Funneliformis geosporum]|nr:20213_t:CDS:2 [Funneliformis geosporum]
MSATLRSNVHVNFLAPDYLDVDDYFKKVGAQDWRLKHYLNYRLETEDIIPSWTTVYEDWINSLNIISKTNHKKIPSQDDNDDNKEGSSNEKRSRHETEEPPIEWELSTPKQNWLDKIAREQQLLTSAMFSNNDTKIRYELSFNPILWKIIDLYDQRIMNLLSENELSELNTAISSSLKNWTILEPMAEISLFFSKRGTQGAILELQKILNNIKEKTPEESDDDLFEDKDTFEK